MVWHVSYRALGDGEGEWFARVGGVHLVVDHGWGGHPGEEEAAGKAGVGAGGLGGGKAE